jgi:hypothetical protein
MRFFFGFGVADGVDERVERLRSALRAAAAVAASVREMMLEGVPAQTIQQRVHTKALGAGEPGRAGDVA